MTYAELGKTWIRLAQDRNDEFYTGTDEFYIRIF